jgi:hypothetical protein
MAINNKRSLLSSPARIQSPWVKVTLGDYTFGVFDQKTNPKKDQFGAFMQYNVQYPNYIKSLNIIKVNGQINQYTLSLHYPVTQNDDPNLIDKILSSVSQTRKIIFSYGDAATPAYTYKDEEAIITGVTQVFSLETSTIQYTIKAVSTASLATSGSFTFVNSGLKKPSDEIRRIFKANSVYGLRDLFTGMSLANFDDLVAGDDKAVELQTKVNISPLDYITYLVGCMVPAGSTTSNVSTDIYILTLHDETVFDSFYSDTASLSGPYFKVTRTSYLQEHADAYEVDIGYNTSTIVLGFAIENQENYSLLYDYNSKLSPSSYARRLNSKGQWEDVYAPMVTSGNDQFLTRPEDVVWFTKMTQYPISATIKVQGLLRPAHLMQFLRLNVIFPGGHKHTSSGLYIVTKQVDDIGETGYFTTLSLTRISD